MLLRNLHKQLIALAILILSLAPSIGDAQPTAATCTPASPWTYLGMYSQLTTIPCLLPVQDGSVTLITIGVEDSRPIKKVRFSLQAPPPGLTILATTPSVLTAGDLSTGMEFDLGGCVSGPVTLATLLVFNTAPFGCVAWEFAPYGPTGAIEAITCDDEVETALGLYHEVYLQSSGGFQCSCLSAERCVGLRPIDLFPADGAIAVPTHVVLSWPAQGAVTFMYIGTDPNCIGQQFIGLGNQTTYAPPFLAPGTTYYWQLGASDEICAANSKVRSFTTTTDPIATETSTWGAIKAIWR